MIDFTKKVHQDNNAEGKYNVTCAKCGKPYKAEGSYLYYELEHIKYKGYCRECYVNDINENPTDEIIKAWAEEAIKEVFYNPGPITCPLDCSFENFENKVRPVIEEMLKERKSLKQREARQKKIDEAFELYNTISCYDENNEKYDYHGYNNDIVLEKINIIASLLERIDNLERKIGAANISFKD